MIKPETYQAIKAGKITNLATTKGTRAYGLRLDLDGDISGYDGTHNRWWTSSGTQLWWFSNIGDLTDDD